MLHAAMGHSDAIVPKEAVAEAIQCCKDGLQGQTPKAGILFTSIMDRDYAPMLHAVLEAFPGIELVGCTTDGEVSDTHDFAEDSVALLLLCSDSLDFASGCGTGVSTTPLHAVQEARDQALARLGSEPSLALVFPDGLSTIATPLDSVLRQVFGPRTPVFGGTAGDHYRLKQTWQFHGARVFTDAIPILLISGPLLHSSHICSGWRPLGQKLTITRSKGNVVHEINDMPAVELFRHYLGDNTKEYIQFPLAVFEPGSQAFSLRDPLYFNEDDGSIQFIGHLPVGSEVQLAEAGREDILQAAASASRQALESYPGQAPSLALIFSCASRRQILGTLSKEECRHLKDNAPAGMGVFGFYTYGEIGPLIRGGATIYHNDTYVVLVLGDR